ncbi:hypothetical protein BC828DRAFT_259680 [Blastocladiella britannica]|nr:hypothetical protein BC828DRAFT_259680 [Blastocladiella britannica]
MTEAQKNYVLALELSNTFWSACKAGATPDALGCIADRLQEHQAEALRFLRTLVRRFPSSVPILKLYASFAFDVLCNEPLGDEILDLAVRLGGGDGTQEKTADDGKSERSGHQSSVTGRSSDVFKVGGAESIFDGGVSGQSRDAASLTTISALRNSSRVALVLMFFAVVALTVMSGQFGATEAAIRNLMYQAGLMRRTSLDVINQARTLQLLILNSAAQTALVAQQKVLRTSATSLLNQLKASFFQTGSQVTSDIISHWAWLALPDRALTKLDVFLNPMETFQLLYLNGFEAGTAPTSSLTANRPSITWILANGLTDTYFGFLLKLVSVYQTAYAGFLANTFWTMETTALALGCVPIIALTVTVLPKWLTLRRELDEATKLFALIPPSVASTLAIEMKSKLDSLTDNATSEGVQDSSTTRGGHVAFQAKGAKSAPLATQLFKALVGSSLLSVAFVAAMALCTVLPFQYYSNRAALLNWPGIRISGTVWTYLGLRELYQLGLTVPTTLRESIAVGNEVQYWRTSVAAMTDMIVSLHASTLYGNASLGLERTFGVFTAADAVNFLPSCSDISNPQCYSLDQNIAYLHDLVTASLSANSVPNSTLSELSRLASTTGPLALQINAVRSIFSLAHEDSIQTLNVGSVWLLLGSLLGFGAMYITLRQQFNAVEDRIKRTRSILFQIPEEATNAIPVIRSYLRTGVLVATIFPVHEMTKSELEIEKEEQQRERELEEQQQQQQRFQRQQQQQQQPPLVVPDPHYDFKLAAIPETKPEIRASILSLNDLHGVHHSDDLVTSSKSSLDEAQEDVGMSTDFQSRMQDYISGVEPLDIIEKSPSFASP